MIGKHAPRAAVIAGAVGMLLIAEAIMIWRSATVLILITAGVWMALPGVRLARQLFGASDPAHIAAWLAGPALGLGLSVFGTFLWLAAGVQGWFCLVLGPALTWGLAWVFSRRGFPTLKLPAFAARDISVAALLVSLVPLITWAPYDHVREPVSNGEAYRAYFTADFVWGMTVTGELAKGQVPPANPFLREQPLHYYWMAHFLSGATYRNVTGWGVPIEAVLLVNGLAFGVAFLLFMYFLVRTVGASPGIGAVAVACGFCANSYEGADLIRAVITHGMPWSELTNTNVDAVTRWFYKGMAVDGLQRLLLYQPHHLTGYVFALAALWLVGLAADVATIGVALGAGVLLALALLFSTFGALIVGVAVGLLYVLRLAQQHAMSRAWQCGILGAGPVVVGVALTSILGYTDTRYGSLLQVGLNPLAAHNPLRVWILSFGPLLFGAVAASTSRAWLLRAGAAPAALASAAVLFYFFTNVPDSGDVWVGWRAGHMLLIAFAAMSGAWLTWVWRLRKWRMAVAVLLFVIIVPAVPTVALDVYNAQDITNRTEAAGFPWTTVITPAEREALEWVRHNTPPEAVVQVDPDARGSAHWSFIGAFAERRMIAGLPIAMTPLQPYRRASDDLKWGVFKTTQVRDCHATARSLGIDYLFIGLPERHWYRPTIIRLRSDPALFPVVFENKEVTILRVASIDPTPVATRRLLR